MPPWKILATMQLCLSLSFSVIPWKTGKSMTACWRRELLRSEQSPLQAHVHGGLCSGWGGSPLLGQHSLLQLLLAQASPFFDGARSRSPDRRQDPASSSCGQGLQPSPAPPKASPPGIDLPAPPPPWVPPGFGILPALTMGSSVAFSNWMRRIFRTSRPLLWEWLPRVAEPLV